jgi:hypothetical protein
MNIPYLITSASVTAVVNGKTFVADRSHRNYEAIKTMLASDCDVFERLVDLFDISDSVNRYCDGKITVKHGVVSYNNVPVDNYVTQKILQFMDEKLPVEPVANFLCRIMKNPSRRAVSELYKFLEHKNMPLTPDGCFLAYKGVLSNYWSKHANRSTRVIRGKVNDSGRIYNGIGEVIEVERNSVCDDASVGCGEGIHAGSLNYANDWADRDGHLMIVKIDPADVVSVPNDCNCQKLRTCKYEVVSEQTDRTPLSDTMTPEDEQLARGYSDGKIDADNGLDSNEDNLQDGPYKDGYIEGYYDTVNLDFDLQP